MTVTLWTITAMLARIFYPYISLGLGTLYPAYASWKSIRHRDRQQYQRWMMYWVTYAAFQACEIFSDIFISFWFPFYYELKVLLLVWMVSLNGQGARVLFLHLINNELTRRERVIDRYLDRIGDLSNELIVRSWQEISKIFPIIMSTFFRIMIATSEGIPSITGISSTSSNPKPRGESPMDLDEIDHQAPNPNDDAIFSYSSSDETPQDSVKKSTRTPNRTKSRDQSKSAKKVTKLNSSLLQLNHIDSDDEDENFNHRLQSDKNLNTDDTLVMNNSVELLNSIIANSAIQDSSAITTAISDTQSNTDAQQKKRTTRSRTSGLLSRRKKKYDSTSDLTAITIPASAGVATSDDNKETDDQESATESATSAQGLQRTRATRKPRAVKKPIFYADP